MPWFTVRAGVVCRSDELITGDDDGVIRVWSGHATPEVLCEERQSGRGSIVAVVPSNQTHTIGGVLDVAAGRCRFMRVAQHQAEDRRSLPDGKCQHHGENCCSKHVQLVVLGS